MAVTELERNRRNLEEEIAADNYRLRDAVLEIHELTAAKGPELREMIRGKTLNSVQMRSRLSRACLTVEDVFRQVRPGFHLEVQITPEAYKKIGRPFVRRDLDPIYYSIAIGLEKQRGREKLSLGLLPIMPRGEGLPYFFLPQSGNRNGDSHGKFLNLRDILNMNIVRNPIPSYPQQGRTR